MSWSLLTAGSHDVAKHALTSGRNFAIPGGFPFARCRPGNFATPLCRASLFPQNLVRRDCEYGSHGSGFHTSGEDLIDQVASGNTDGVSSLLARLPSQFISKPSFGYQGRGVQFYAVDRQGAVALIGDRTLTFDEFLQSLRKSFDAKAIGEGPSTGDHVLLLQEIGRAHPLIAELSGSWVMQSTRICTILDGTRDEPAILFSFLKINAGGNLIDNFQKGATGNLLAYIDESTGAITRTIGPDPSRKYNRVLTKHPDTGAGLIGVRVPYWHEALDLARRAASVFANTRGGRLGHRHHADRPGARRRKRHLGSSCAVLSPAPEIAVKTCWAR